MFFLAGGGLLALSCKRTVDFSLTTSSQEEEFNTLDILVLYYGDGCWKSKTRSSGAMKRSGEDNKGWVQVEKERKDATRGEVYVTCRDMGRE